MSSETLIKQIKIKIELKNRIKYNKIDTYFPDKGPLRRELYKKHMEFFEAGATFTERCCLAANRIGKTESMGGYEVTCHLTGIYPVWWVGRRFDHPTDGWAAGDTSQTVRDILQYKLLGDIDDIGSGLIPKHLISKTTKKAGSIPDSIETIRVKHSSGGTSILGFKSYDQKRKSFQGTFKDFVWEDEEPPLDIHSECKLRIMDTSGGDDPGLLISTYTPLEGLTETVMYFLPKGDWNNIVNTGSKYLLMATWDDVPHISKKQADDLYKTLPPHQRDARSKGIPQLGSGAIFPIPETEITVDDFEIPEHWPKLYGLDVGWNNTAAVWGALDRETGTIYIYSVYKKGKAEPVIHTEAIKARGDWIKGKIDPASRGRSQHDGLQLMQSYLDLGLNLTTAKNAVEAGLFECWTGLSTGKIKVFKSCSLFFEEYRLYRRDTKGKVIKVLDHIMDAFRYLFMDKDEAEVKPVEDNHRHRPRAKGWRN